MRPHPPRRPDKLTVFARFVQYKLRVPVIVAVCASVPAVFLTVWTDGDLALAGKIVGWAAGAVLWLESVILLLAAENKREWLWRHKWMLLVCALTLLSLAAAAGGAQVLRLAYLVGTIRALRAKRIVDAAAILVRRFSLGIWWKSGLFTGAGVIAAAVAVVLLADPDAEYRELLHWLDTNLRLLPILLAGAVLAVATWLVVRTRTARRTPAPELPLTPDPADTPETP
ncbi:metal-sensitive transcriptional repressor family protein [Glycomyces paridis]|uniref:Metal-sensitive transcriptional repressor family protein n=1 Tax=Glycomyces paridis TaxID=2126555 RepID=A0A4S8PDX1_9ACTN|nr:metal-sensitive transcriptional repressor family protein [Glycomyces paridis]THV28001.1 metal-sensitive transcriptional repressor family protein [Glycomyces paridis]